MAQGSTATTPELLLKFGVRVREIRVNKGLSQERLASLAGVHRTYVGMVERGEKNVTLVTISKFAHALGLSVAELLESF